MTIKAKLGGSVYRVKKHQLSQIKLYSELECLTKAERKFLLGLIDLCSTFENMANCASEIDVTRKDLQDWFNCGITIIKTRSSSLTKTGVFTKKQYQRPKCKPADLFILSNISDIVDAPLEQEVKKFKDHRPHRHRLSEIKAQLIEGDEQILDGSLIRLARSERLWNSVLGSCMRSSRNDPRRNKHFTTIYRFGSDTIKIITSSQTNSEICHVDDQRTIRAIITLVCIEISDRMQLEKEIKNEFYIDIVDLCKVMGLDGSGANRDTVRDSMKRLYSTNFNLLLDSESKVGHKFSEHFGIHPGADDLNFRFLTELDSSIDREHGGGSVRRPRWYRIALHSKTFQDIADVNVISTFIDNKEILKVSSGLIHIFYTWCSVHVKRHGNRKISIALPKLWNYMIPGTRYDNFRDRFLTALKNHHEKSSKLWSEDGINHIQLFGYIIKIESDITDDYIISAYRDKNDHVIGDNSTHNRLVKSKIVSELEQSQSA